MTLDRLIATLQHRIARSHTAGGCTAVARELGLTKQTLANIVTGRHTPTKTTHAAIVAALAKKG